MKDEGGQIEGKIKFKIDAEKFANGRDFNS